MSESETHVRLVSALLDVIQSEWNPALVEICADMTSDGRYKRPYHIGGVRPDLLVRQNQPVRLALGEAKTIRDIDTLHTYTQLKEFFEHLITQPTPLLWLSVPLAGAGAAIRVARNARESCLCHRVPFRVSGWLLGPTNLEKRWDA